MDQYTHERRNQGDAAGSDLKLHFWPDLFATDFFARHDYF